MNRFEYLEAHSLRQASSILGRHPGSRVLAGGTDVLIRWRQGSWRPSCLVDVSHIKGLERLSYSRRTGLRLGALVHIRALELDPLVRERYTALTAAATSFAGVQIRNLATVGGNVCNASPAGETLPPLLAFEAEAHVQGPSGDRWVPLDRFFTGPGRTVLGLGELVSEFCLPPVPEHSGSLYIKHSPRKAMDIAIVGVAVSVCTDPRGGACRTARIALGAVGPTPIRAREAEALLAGRPVDAALIAEAAARAATESTPIDDIRGQAWYRRSVVETLVQHALTHSFSVARLGVAAPFELVRDLAVESGTVDESEASA